MRRIVAVVIVVWLIMGVVAAVRRNYVTGSAANCSRVATIGHDPRGSVELRRGQPEDQLLGAAPVESIR